MTRIRNAASTVAIALAAGAVACGPRQAQVSSAPSQPTQVSIQVRNTLAQAVNVYVTVGGSDTFLRQVGGNSTATIPVQGIATGTTVGLKAVTVDGSKTYSRSNVTLNGTYVFPLP